MFLELGISLGNTRVDRLTNVGGYPDRQAVDVNDAPHHDAVVGSGCERFCQR
jgi:hypothetical protein